MYAELMLDCGHLGGLLLLVAGGKEVWSDLLEVFEPRLRDAVVSPLRNSTLRHVAHLSNKRSSTKIVDDFVIVHAESIDHYTATVQHALPINV